MGIRAILRTLPYKVKQDVEVEIYRNYMARCARILTENTAMMVRGEYINAEYEDIVHPRPKVEYKKGEIASKIKAKLR